MLGEIEQRPALAGAVGHVSERALTLCEFVQLLPRIRFRERYHCDPPDPLQIRTIARGVLAVVAPLVGE